MVKITWRGIAGIILGLYLLPYAFSENVSKNVLFIIFSVLIIICSILIDIKSPPKLSKWRFLILIIPLFLIPILFLQDIGVSEAYISGSWVGGNDTTQVSTDVEYDLDKNNLLSARMKFSALFGKSIDLPLYKICLKTNGSDQVEIFSFHSSVYLNSKLVVSNLYLVDEKCFNLNPDYDENILVISLSYETASNVFFREPININISIEPRKMDLFISMIIFLISYWVVLWLFTRMVVLWREGIK